MGCDQGDAPIATDAPCRGVASLSPAISESIEALGCEAYLVGRTPWCDVEHPVSVVGSLLDVDAEAVLRVHPCAILVQPTATGIDPALRELAARAGAHVSAWPLSTLADIRAMTLALPGHLGLEGDALRAAQNRAHGCVDAMDRACDPLPCARGLRVLIVQSGPGRLAFGPSTYLSEQVAACGFVNAVHQGGWSTLSIEEAMALRPQIVLVVGSTTTPWVDALRDRCRSLVVTVRDDQLLLPSAALGAPMMSVRSALARAVEEYE